MTSHILERVPLQQVRLLPGEHFDAQQAGAWYLLELDVDCLLYPFRREAGLPQPTDRRHVALASRVGWWRIPVCDARAWSGASFGNRGDCRFRGKRR